MANLIYLLSSSIGYVIHRLKEDIIDSCKVRQSKQLLLYVCFNSFRLIYEVTDLLPIVNSS